MDVNRRQLEEASQKGLISAEQAQQLWHFLGEQGQDTPSFRSTHILYYLGGLIAIGAMSLFMTLGFESFGGWGLFFIALVYAGAGIWLTEYLLNQSRLPIPAGITAAFVVCLTPLAVYGLQSALGWWDDGLVFREFTSHIDSRWLFMELATLVCGAAMLWRYRLPFLVLPVAVTLWYVSMDLAPLLFKNADLAGELSQQVSLWFGLLILLLAFLVDLHTHQNKDYAFWLYLFGVMAFWGGLSVMGSNNGLDQFIYFCINLAMIVVGAVLSRRVFAVFGGLGAAGYLSYLAYDVFADSMMFPIALTAIGLGLIGLGIAWQRNEAAIGKTLRRVLPPAMRAFFEGRD
jgi:hypothetical protein